MARLIVDASVALRWFLEDERTAEADALLDRVLAGQDEVVAPPLLRGECFNALTRIVIREPPSPAPVHGLRYGLPDAGGDARRSALDWRRSLLSCIAASAFFAAPSTFGSDALASHMRVAYECASAG